MRQYLAITIGPIFDTLQQARKTRELWAASYLFSHLMGFLIEEFKKMENSTLLPSKVDDPRQRYGAGIYNDRMFAELPPTAPSAIDAAIDKAVERLAREIAPGNSTPNPAFWRQYLRIEWMCKPLDTLKGGALFAALAPVLDSAELYTPYAQENESGDVLTEFLTRVYKTPMAQNALEGKAKGKYAGLMNGLFPSTIDLASFELYQQDGTAYKSLREELDKLEDKDQEKVKDQESFYEKLFSSRTFKPHARDYHKYFCIVHADGDNLGSLNATLESADDYRNLSEKLSRFALDAAQTIDDYGGKPVFIGGDDLLFFAPVCARKDGQTVSVFQLIDTLSRQYDALNLGEKTHLSFGITLSYYKFPLFEARELSYEQLTFRAKKARWRDGASKNAVAFRLLKHSGAYFEGVLSKPVLTAFVAAENDLRKGKDDLISGIVYKMETLNGLLGLLAKEQRFDSRMDNLFHNFFNEPVHKHERNSRQMELIKNLLKTVYEASAPLQQDTNLYAILRLLKFVTDRGEPAPAGAYESQLADSTI